MNIGAMAQAIYAKMNEGKYTALPWDALGDEDSPTHVGKRTIVGWAEAAAAVAVDVPMAEPESAPVVEPPTDEPAAV